MSIDQNQFDALLKEISRIASALNDPRSSRLSEEVPIAAAARNVDYLALRQLMGRVRRDGEPVAVYPASRRRGSASGKAVLVLGPLPDDVDNVAVFTQRGDPADVVPLAGHPTTFVAKSKLPEYPLPNVTNDQVITRLEFRRADDYPLALGPRLPVV